jgi:phosphate acetyltransferase
MNIIHDLEERAGKLNRTVVLPETEDPRVIHAAASILEKKSCGLILIGDPESIDVPEPDNQGGRLQIRAWNREPDPDKYLDYLQLQLEYKGLTRKEAGSMLDDPLIFAGALVALNEADAAVAGSVATTASVIRAGIYTIGVHPGSKLVSSIFLMALPDGRCVTYSDCAVVPYPDSEQLASIAIDAGHTHHKLTNTEPRIAFLSFSTKGSAKHERVDLVREAVIEARSLNKGWIIDGELQFDSAFVPDIARKKAPESELKGEANVFVFPNLDAGNIAYKITERLAGARATGPILQGLKKPYLDLSRGCTAEDIQAAIHVACVLSDPLLNEPI